MKALGTLDRYVLRHWMGTFLLAALGIPAVATLINLAERFGPLSKRGVPVDDILLGQALFFPGQVTLLLPASRRARVSNSPGAAPSRMESTPIPRRANRSCNDVSNTSESSWR